MRSWKLTGFIATVIIVLTIPFYLLKITVIRPQREVASAQPITDFVGSKKCLDCHKKEYDKWLDSHHDLAMDVANEKTVLGDFDNAMLEIHGVTLRFYRKDDRFYPGSGR